MTQIRTQAKPAYSTMPPRVWFFYGEAKVGKTTTAAAFPATLILNPKVEDRATEITGDVWDIPIGDIEALKQAITFLASGKHEYKYVCFDAVTAYLDNIIARAPDKNPMRKVKQANDLLIPVLTDFFALPIGKTLTGHAKHDQFEIEIAGNNGYKSKANKIAIYPDLPQSFRTFITARVTAFGYCYPGPADSLVRWTSLEQERLSISAGNGLGLPDIMQLRYANIERAVVTAKLPASSPAPAPSATKDLAGQWADFCKANQITPSLIEAALGVKSASTWIEQTGRTLGDCMGVVLAFKKQVENANPDR